jgi:hypothetical protein
MAACFCVQPYFLLVVHSARARGGCQTVHAQRMRGAEATGIGLVSACCHNFPVHVPAGCCRRYCCFEAVRCPDR